MGNSKTVDPKKTVYIIDIIAVVLMVGFGRVVPPFGPVTEVGVYIIGIFLGVILLTVATNQMFFASVAAMAAMIICGYTTANDAIVSWLGSSTVATFIFVSAFCIGLKETGAMAIIAKKLLMLKALRGRPKLLIFIFFVTTYIVSMFLKFAPALVLMFGLFESIRDICGYEKKSPFCKFMLLGIFMGCGGNYALPFLGIQMTTISMADSVMSEYGIVFSNLTYFITNVIVFIVWLLVYTLLMGRVFKCDLKPLRELDVTQVASLRDIRDHFDKRQIILLCAFIFCVVDLILTSVFPKAPGINVLTSIGATWIWLLVIAILSIFKVADQPVIVPQKVLESTMWNVVCMIGAFSMLGAAMSSEDLGIRTWIVNLISPLFGQMSLPILIVLVVVVVTFATNFVNGLPLTLACNAAVLPFVCQMQVGSGVSASVMATLFGICANMAYLTAAGSVYSSLIISREEIAAKWLWSKGLTVLVGFMAVVAVVGIILSYVLP